MKSIREDQTIESLHSNCIFFVFEGAPPKYVKLRAEMEELKCVHTKQSCPILSRQLQNFEKQRRAEKTGFQVGFFV